MTEGHSGFHGCCEGYGTVDGLLKAPALGAGDHVDGLQPQDPLN